MLKALIFKGLFFVCGDRLAQGAHGSAPILRQCRNELGPARTPVPRQTPPFCPSARTLLHHHGTAPLLARRAATGSVAANPLARVGQAPLKISSDATVSGVGDDVVATPSTLPDGWCAMLSGPGRSDGARQAAWHRAGSE